MFGNRFRIPLLVVLAIVVFGSSVDAVSLAYRFRPGVSYQFELTSQKLSEAKFLDIRFSNAAETKGEVGISVITFRDGVFVLDIRQGDRRFRRYLKPNGAIAAAPTETGGNLPFLITLPEGDWVQGKVHRITGGIPLGQTRIPVFWDLQFTGLDQTKKKANIKISGKADFPADRLLSRTLTWSGNLVLSVESGLPESGELNAVYGMTLANKEIAVIRDLWGFQETRGFSFRLKGGAK